MRHGLPAQFVPGGGNAIVTGTTTPVHVSIFTQ
jgi:hypothetical protein